jgi:hypothetical protein
MWGGSHPTFILNYTKFGMASEDWVDHAGFVFHDGSLEKYYSTHK